MAWDIEYTDEFGEWWNSLSENEQESVRASVVLLEEYGPICRRPAVPVLRRRNMPTCGN